MPFVNHSLGKTHYKSKGRLSKKNLPIIMLHGGPGGSCHGMESFFELSQDRKVFIYDQIGGGKSSKIEKNRWKVETFVKELENLIKHWGIDEFILFGASWGTTLALEYFLNGKVGTVKSLVFQSPMFSAADWRNDANKLIKKLNPKTRDIINTCHRIGATDSKVYESAVMEYYLKHVLRNKKKLFELFSLPDLINKEIYEYMWGPSEFAPTGTLKKYNKVSKLKNIDVPTLFICGEFDEATPKTTTRYKGLVKSAQIEVIKSSSHCISFEKPKLLNSKISKFLKNQNL